MSMSTMTSSGETIIPNGWAGQIDSVPSLESKRPLENRAVTEALQAIDHDMDYLENLRSSLNGYGMSKICPTELTDATTDGGMVLGAREKNPSIKGTLADNIEEIKDLLKSSAVYKGKTSTTSFLDASYDKSPAGPATVLDKAVRERIGTFQNQGGQFFTGSNGGNLYYIELNKFNESYYCGSIQTYGSGIACMKSFYSHLNGVYSFLTVIPICF